MNFKKRSIIQIAVTLSVACICITYYFYIQDFIDFKILSIGDMNPYGGWSALKSSLTDLSYRFSGISKSMALTMAVAITSLLMGRFFCSYICPIGALQDFFKYIGKVLNIKEIKLPRTKYFNSEILKYFVLAAVLVFSILGVGNLISPISPWLAYLNVFIGFNLQAGSLILIMIMLASVFFKRIFCRCFCPLGAFQSLLYAVGPIKVIKSNNCNGCMNCLKNCPVDIEYSDDSIVSPECINCSECTSTTCIKGNDGFNYKFAGRKINHYMFKSILLFLAIYLLLPLTPSTSTALSMSSLANLEDGTYSGLAIGFGGNIEVEVTINDNKIKNISTIANNETSGYYEEVFKEISIGIKETQSFNADAISGATATSRGYLNAVKDAVSKSIK